MTPAETSAPSATTDLTQDGPARELAKSTREAVAAAQSVAAAAGLQVRSLAAIADFEAVQHLYDQIWRPGGTNSQVTTELLRALSKAGSYVGGAFDRGQLVGACIGFFGPPSSAMLHSHIAGVSPRLQGRNVGFALKVHQRAWSQLRGIREISWTFDPLIARNAYFNLSKLSGDPVAYLANFYGRMNDGINGGDDTDRLLVSWWLNAPAVADACSGRHRSVPAEVLREAAPALSVASSGAPVTTPRPLARTVLVGVPPDIERMRRTDPALATDWRVALRNVLGGLLHEGARVRGFDRAGWYVVDTRPDAPAEGRDEGREQP